MKFALYAMLTVWVCYLVTEILVQIKEQRQWRQEARQYQELFSKFQPEERNKDQ